MWNSVYTESYLLLKWTLQHKFANQHRILLLDTDGKYESAKCSSANGPDISR